MIGLLFLAASESMTWPETVVVLASFVLTGFVAWLFLRDDDE